MELDHWDELMRLRKRYTQALEPVCKHWGLTHNELEVLLFLADNPHFDRAVDIVQRQGLAKSHVSVSVQGLEKRGLLRRLPQPEDHRAIHLCITDQAMEPIAQGRQARRAFFGRLAAILTPEEQAQARALLEKLRDNLTKMEEENH